MSGTPIQKHRWIFRRALLGAFVASLVLGLVVEGLHSVAHAQSVPAKYAFIVIIDGGHPELYNATNTPFLTSLKAQGASYTSAQAQVPADSITNNMGLFTGTDASHHGLPYETFWDRQ